MSRSSLAAATAAAVLALGLAACGTDDGTGVRQLDDGGTETGTGAGSGTHTGSQTGTATEATESPTS